MRRTIHRSAGLHALVLTLALLFAWTPLSLNPAPAAAQALHALQALPLGLPLQGFWDVVAQMSGR
jgi:uncharacterized membrane protein